MPKVGDSIFNKTGLILIIYHLSHVFDRFKIFNGFIAFNEGCCDNLVIVTTCV